MGRRGQEPGPANTVTDTTSFNGILHALRDPVLELDRAGAILWANPAAEFWLAGGESLANRVLTEFIVDEPTAKEILADLSTVGEGEFGCELEVRASDSLKLRCDLSVFREPEWSHFIALLHLQPGEGASPETLSDQALLLSQRLSSLQETTHSLSAELLDKTILLAEEKSKTEAVLASMGEGLLVFDRAGLVVQVNEAACRILEVSPAEVVYQELKSFNPGSKIAIVTGAVWQQRGAVPIPAEDLQRVRLAVQEKVLELSLSPIQETTRAFDVGGYVVNLRDVTRQAEIDRMKEELISIVSHELRSPLANVVGYLDLVLSQPDSEIPEQPLQFLDVAQKNARKLVGILDEMLDLSRLDAGKVEMSLGDVEIDAMLHFTAMSFKPDAEAKKLSVSIDSVGEPIVCADIDRLQRVLNNLVGNAVKYTPEGGSIFLSCEQIGGEVRVLIRDTGIGIRAEDQVKLFQRFFRVRSDETRNITGTGLGLSIAKSIMDAMGGRLSFKSEYGEGTEFTLVLPASRGA